MAACVGLHFDADSLGGRHALLTFNERFVPLEMDSFSLLIWFAVRLAVYSQHQSLRGNYYDCVLFRGHFDFANRQDDAFTIRCLFAFSQSWASILVMNWQNCNLQCLYYLPLFSFHLLFRVVYSSKPNLRMVPLDLDACLRRREVCNRSHLLL